MLIKFAEPFDEYSEGSKNYLKKDEPFTVSDGERMLTLTGKVPTEKAVDGKTVSVLEDKNIFEEIKEVKSSVLPDDFPQRELLEKNKLFTFEQVAAVSVNDLEKIKGIGAGYAEQIKAAIRKYAEESGIELPVEVTE